MQARLESHPLTRARELETALLRRPSGAPSYVHPERVQGRHPVDAVDQVDESALGLGRKALPGAGRIRSASLDALQIPPDLLQRCSTAGCLAMPQSCRSLFAKRTSTAVRVCSSSCGGAAWGLAGSRSLWSSSICTIEGLAPCKLRRPRNPGSRRSVRAADMSAGNVAFFLARVKTRCRWHRLEHYKRKQSERQAEPRVEELGSEQVR